LKVLLVPNQATSLLVITFIPSFWVMLTAVVKTAEGWIFRGWTISEQGAEHVGDLRELGLDRGIVSVLAGNGILTFLNWVGKLVETGSVGHCKWR
jgi:hypothetical protein